MKVQLTGNCDQACISYLCPEGKPIIIYMVHKGPTYSITPVIMSNM